MSHENYEHSYLLYGHKKPNVMTTVIGCQAQHPYFKMLQEHLLSYQYRFSRDVLHATGPFFLNDIYAKYLRLDKNNNTVTVIHPRYWLPRYDHRLTAKLRAICRMTSRLTPNGRDTCTRLRRTEFRNKLTRDAFLDHHWTHVNTWKKTKKLQDTFNLFTVVPHAIRASTKLNCRR